MHTAAERAAHSQPERIKTKTWWMVLWQDSLLSVGYDRATSTALPESAYPPSDPKMLAELGGFSYQECMWRIGKVGLLTVRNRVLPQSMDSRLSTCQGLREEIENTQAQAAEHLKDVSKCRSSLDHVEHWILYLQASYMMSELCRPGVSPGNQDANKNHQLRRLCIVNLLNTVDAFNGLAMSSPLHTRTWSIKHRALSAALLLGILGEPLRNSHAPWASISSPSCRRGPMQLTKASSAHRI